MFGAIIGDIVGSRFEFHNNKTKDFRFFHSRCRITDDSVLSIAVCKSLLQFDGDYEQFEKIVCKNIWEIGRQYPKAGFGGRFRHWLRSDDPKPYESFGNGSAMRVSGCGYASDSEDVVKKLAIITSGVTHNHPEGLKGGEATAVAVYLARIGKSMDEIALALSKYYKFDFTLDDIRPHYEFDETCQGTLPVAIKAFLESTSYEDAIRNAISVGGDSDTIGAITGAMAEAYFGIPQALRQDALQYIPKDLLEILEAFEEKYPPKII